MNKQIYLILGKIEAMFLRENCCLSRMLAPTEGNATHSEVYFTKMITKSVFYMELGFGLQLDNQT